jgi:hypothetical protein
MMQLEVENSIKMFNPPAEIPADLLAKTKVRMADVLGIGPDQRTLSLDELSELRVPANGDLSIKAGYLKGFDEMVSAGFELVTPNRGHRPTLSDFATNQIYTCITFSFRQGGVEVMYIKAGIHPIPSNFVENAERSFRMPATTNINGPTVAIWASFSDHISISSLRNESTMSDLDRAIFATSKR